jgi:hypothetical protein
LAGEEAPGLDVAGRIVLVRDVDEDVAPEIDVVGLVERDRAAGIVMGIDAVPGEGAPRAVSPHHCRCPHHPLAAVVEAVLGVSSGSSVTT